MYPAMPQHPFKRLRTPTMTATRLKTDAFTQDVGSTRPVLSAATSTGLFSGLLQAIMPGKAKAQRAEPRLAAETRTGGERREPQLFGPRPASGAAD
jgi:hypothetical protein